MPRPSAQPPRHAERTTRSQIKDHIRQIPDFPKPGILFYDISTLLAHAAGLARDRGSCWPAPSAPHRPDLLVGIESRGFLVAAPLALKLDCGFVMVRKKGKLPGATIPQQLRRSNTAPTRSRCRPTPYGRASAWWCSTISWRPAAPCSAAIALLRKVGADVRAAACIIELAFLKGRERLDVPFTSVVCYDQ